MQFLGNSLTEHFLVEPGYYNPSAKSFDFWDTNGNNRITKDEVTSRITQRPVDLDEL